MPRKLYLMDCVTPPDGALIRRHSHRLLRFKTGQPLDPALEGPIVFRLDEELRRGPLPTFFSVPALVARRAFCDDLLALGVDNIETRSALLEDPVDGRRIEGYLYLNVVGLVAGADLARSSSEELGPGMTVINELVLDYDRFPDLDVCLLAEDPDNLIVSERVRDHLGGRGYDDVFFEEIRRSGS